MRGLVGAATIIGCLKYGASFCGQDDQDDPVFLIRIKDEDLLEAPDDAAFLQSLRHSCARVSGVYPPLALVEAYITEEDSAPRVRRLHLIIVDLHRRRRMANRVLRLLADLHIDRCAGECLNTVSSNGLWDRTVVLEACCSRSTRLWRSFLFCSSSFRPHLICFHFFETSYSNYVVMAAHFFISENTFLY